MYYSTQIRRGHCEHKELEKHLPTISPFLPKYHSEYIACGFFMVASHGLTCVCATLLSYGTLIVGKSAKVWHALCIWLSWSMSMSRLMFARDCIAIYIYIYFYISEKSLLPFLGFADLICDVGLNFYQWFDTDYEWARVLCGYMCWYGTLYSRRYVRLYLCRHAGNLGSLCQVHVHIFLQYKWERKIDLSVF